MINHIKAIHDPERSWCGQSVDDSETHFKTVDEATLNGLHFGETENCHECVNVIIENLKKAQAGRKFK